MHAIITGIIFPCFQGKSPSGLKERGSGYLIDCASTGKTLDHPAKLRIDPIHLGRTIQSTFFQRVIRRISDPRFRRARQILAGLAVLALLLISPITPSLPVQADVPAGDSEYFIPGFSQDLRTILVDIDNDPVITNTMHNVITVSVGGDNTTVYYDHWEDGYGTLATGYNERYTASKGDILTFESPTIPSNPRGGNLDSCPGSVFPAGGSRADNRITATTAATGFTRSAAPFRWRRLSGRLRAGRCLPTPGRSTPSNPTS